MLDADRYSAGQACGSRSRRLAGAARCFARSTLLAWLALAGLVGAGSAAADDAREAVFGIWATSGTMIEVGPEGDGLSATIISLKNPNWREKDGVGVVGEPKTDLHNPDESLQEQPLIGLQMLHDYEFRNGKWQGRLYLPTNGSLWKSSAWVRNGLLHIRGFLGISLLGKTQTFVPLSTCNENIVRMIRNSGITGTPCDDLLAGGGE